MREEFPGGGRDEKEGVAGYKPDFVPPFLPRKGIDVHLSDATNTWGSASIRRGRPLQPGRRPVPLFCLAPHGVFRAPAITLGAVGFYPAVSPLPENFRFRKNLGRFIFCDTVRRLRITRKLPRFRRACCLVVSGLSSPFPERTSASQRHPICFARFLARGIERNYEKRRASEHFSSQPTAGKVFAVESILHQDAAGVISSHAHAAVNPNRFALGQFV